VVVQTHEVGKERWLEFMGYQQARMIEYTSGIPTALISTNSFGGTYQALLRHNFSPSHIPHSLGGDFDYDMVADWVRERISIEDVMGAAPPRGNVMPHRVMTAAAGYGDPSSQKNTTGRGSQGFGVYGRFGVGGESRGQSQGPQCLTFPACLSLAKIGNGGPARALCHFGKKTELGPPVRVDIVF
jgi:hypothetical protein